jgi:hypothetical protein
MSQELIVRQSSVPQDPPKDHIKRVTQEDIDTYSPELIDLMRRAAQEAVEPILSTVRQENQQTRQQVNNQTRQSYNAQLDELMPDWRTIQPSARFQQWCRKPDVYAGVIRGKLLDAAVKAADAPRVAAFYRGFLDEEQATGNSPQSQQATPPRQAAVDLKTLAAPGRPNPAAGSAPAPAEYKPIITLSQIRAFYSQEGRARYVGRDKDRANDEQIIFDAQREGRVKG